jgi:hypothetical protein
LRNVTISNVSGSAQSGGIIVGLRGSPIQNVRFENCKVSAQKGLAIRNARSVDYSGLELTVREGPPVTLSGVE